MAAWVIWDPFLAAVQPQAGARILVDGSGLAAYRRFYLAAAPFARRRPDVLAVVFAELQRAGDWIKKNPGQAAEWRAPVIGLAAATVEAANARRSDRVQPVDAQSLVEQQRIADAFSAAGIIPRKVVVADSPVWRRAWPEHRVQSRQVDAAEPAWPGRWRRPPAGAEARPQQRVVGACRRPGPLALRDLQGRRRCFGGSIRSRRGQPSVSLQIVRAQFQA